MYFLSVSSSLDFPLGSVAITSQNMVQMKKDFILEMDIVSFETVFGALALTILVLAAIDF